MTGIRKKIFVGFASLGLLLFFSGLISYFELTSLSRNTQSLIASGARNIEHAKNMLDAVQRQNTALLQIVVTNDNSYDSMLLSGREDFLKSLSEATVSISDLRSLDAVYAAKEQYDAIVDAHLDGRNREENISWFMDIYATSYYDLTTAIKNYMISSHYVIGAKTAQIESNAYRAIMPSIIALAIAIIIIITFAFLVDVYYITPVIRISSALKNFLTAKIPFHVKMEGRDEVAELKDNIDTLIQEYKSKKSE